MQQRLSKNAVLEEKSVILVLNQVKVKRKSSIIKSRTFVNRHRYRQFLKCESEKEETTLRLEELLKILV